MMIPLMTFLAALISSAALVPLVRRISFRLGMVSQPRQDRWHRQPTATLGGVGVFFGFLFGLLAGAWAGQGWAQVQWGILLGAVIVFALGLYDDFKRLSPQAKLGGQILAATTVVALGYTTNFFSPRIDNEILAQLPNILLTVLWLVGITNAINLLDNMDGLAGGIALIAAGFLSYFFWRAGDQGLLLISLAVAGGALGFLLFNFPPASIFMGDSGSLFLGFTLALLAIARQPQASNIFAVMGAPTLLFLLPILDTILVTFTRLLRGQSPIQGGRDHTSHRLIAFGLSERQAVLALYAVAVFSGVTAAALESIRYIFSLVLAPLVILSLTLVIAYLGRLKVVPAATPAEREKPLTRIMLELTMRRRLLEVALDFFLIGMAYFLAFLTHYGVEMSQARLAHYLSSLPLALLVAYLAFFSLGVYRGVWRYIDLNDLVRYLRAALGSAVLLAAVAFVLVSLGDYLAVNPVGRPSDLPAGLTTTLPPAIPLFFGVYLFLGLAATRSSFRILDLFSAQRVRVHQERVLIYGAGDAGEMALRWLLMNAETDYQAVGFLDDDPFLAGRQIHSVKVLGGLERLEKLLAAGKIDGLILAGVDPASPNGAKALAACRGHGCWARQLRLGFEEID